MTHDKPGTSKPYRARVTRGGNDVSLGYFATAEEAALCVARTPEGQAAAKRPAAAAPLTSTEARQQAEAEGLTLTLTKVQSATANEGRDGLLRRGAQAPRPSQALRGAGDARRQQGAPGQLRHRRGGGAVRRTVARGADGCVADAARSAAAVRPSGDRATHSAASSAVAK